jgi:hypothetical protein
MDLKIRKRKSRKDQIKQPDLSEQDIIPRLGTSTILNGQTGSGKTNLLLNLVTESRFLGDAFDQRYLFSPTAEGDDMQKELKVPKNHVFIDLKKAPKIIGMLDKTQTESVKKVGPVKAKQVANFFDDFISYPEFCRSPEFIQAFIAGRHKNFTNFACTQSWTKVPRACRLQAKNIFFFEGSQSEVELLAEEFTPARLSKRDFMAMVQWATSEPFAFLYINMSVTAETRFRKNLDHVIDTGSWIGKGSNALKATVPDDNDGEQAPEAQAIANPDGGSRPGHGGEDVATPEGTGHGGAPGGPALHGVGDHQHSPREPENGQVYEEYKRRAAAAFGKRAVKRRRL